MQTLTFLCPFQLWWLPPSFSWWDLWLWAVSFEAHVQINSQDNTQSFQTTLALQWPPPRWQTATHWNSQHQKRTMQVSHFSARNFSLSHWISQPETLSTCPHPILRVFSTHAGGLKHFLHFISDTLTLSPFPSWSLCLSSTWGQEEIQDHGVRTQPVLHILLLEVVYILYLHPSWVSYPLSNGGVLHHCLQLPPSPVCLRDQDLNLAVPIPPNSTKVCGGWWTDTNIYAKMFDFDIVFLKKTPLLSLLDRFYLAFGFWKLFVCENRTISE